MQPSKDLWVQLHEFLHQRDELRFPVPLQPCSDLTFSALFKPEQPSVHLILDEAYALHAMPEQAIASFLATVRMLRQYRTIQTRRASLASLTLLGVEGLAAILRHRSWESSDVNSPFTIVSPVASHSQPHRLCQLHVYRWSTSVLVFEYE